MNIKKPLIVTGVLSGIAIASFTGVGVVSAHTEGMAGSDSIATKIAQRFNLKEEEVAEVLEEERTARKADMRAQFEARLTQAVADGKLTAEQKDSIIAKHKQMLENHRANHEAMKEKSSQERRAAKQAARAELQKWIEENDIPAEYFYLVSKESHGRGHRE